MSVFDFIRQAPLDQLFRWWDGTDLLPNGFADGYLDEIAFALTERGEPGITKLKQSLDAADPERRRAAIYFLAFPDVADAEVEAALVRAFESEDRNLKAVVLWGFIHLGFFPLDRRLVSGLLEQADQRLAAQVMVYLSRAHPAETVSILWAALRSSNPRMREYACDKIGDRTIEELFDEMRPRLNDPDEDVAQAAESNLVTFGDPC